MNPSLGSIWTEFVSDLETSQAVMYPPFVRAHCGSVLMTFWMSDPSSGPENKLWCKGIMVPCWRAISRSSSLAVV